MTNIPPGAPGQNASSTRPLPLACPECEARQRKLDEIAALCRRYDNELLSEVAITLARMVLRIVEGKPH